MRSYWDLNRRMEQFWTEVTTMLDEDHNPSADTERNQVHLFIVNAIRHSIFITLKQICIMDGLEQKRKLKTLGWIFLMMFAVPF